MDSRLITWGGGVTGKQEEEARMSLRYRVIVGDIYATSMKPR